jgi:hypothetical protein
MDKSSINIETNFSQQKEITRSPFMHRSEYNLLCVYFVIKIFEINGNSVYIEDNILNQHGRNFDNHAF